MPPFSNGLARPAGPGERTIIVAVQVCSARRGTPLPTIHNSAHSRDIAFAVPRCVAQGISLSQSTPVPEVPGRNPLGCLQIADRHVRLFESEIAHVPREGQDISVSEMWPPCLSQSPRRKNSLTLHTLQITDELLSLLEVANVFKIYNRFSPTVSSWRFHI